MRYSLLDSKRDHVEQNAHNDAVTVLEALSPQRIISGSRGGDIRIWDVGSSNRMVSIEMRQQAHDGPISAIATNTRVNSNWPLVFSASSDDPEDAITIWRLLEEKL